MKKVFLLMSAVVMAMCLNAADEIIQVDGIYYQVNVENQTAILLQDQSDAKVYDLEEIVVPVSVEKDGIKCDVVALGKAAFRFCTAKSITFEAGSKVAEIGMQAFQRAHNIKELVLPDGIKLMPLTGIHTDQQQDVEPFALEKLVLPASLDSLAMMSVVAPNLKVLEFVGTVPPRCCHKYIAATDYYQVPWEINATHANFTSKECLVIVPDETLDAYKAAPGIGDYFTNIIEKKDVPSAIENINNTILQSGIYTATGIYVGEDITVLPKGLYIVNGKKVVR